MSSIVIPQLDFNNNISTLIYNNVDLLFKRDPIYFSNIDNLIFRLTDLISKDDVLQSKRENGKNVLKFISNNNNVLKSLTINGEKLIFS